MRQPWHGEGIQLSRGLPQQRQQRGQAGQAAEDAGQDGEGASSTTVGEDGPLVGHIVEVRVGTLGQMDVLIACAHHHFLLTRLASLAASVATGTPNCDYLLTLPP